MSGVSLRAERCWRGWMALASVGVACAVVGVGPASAGDWTPPVLKAEPPVPFGRVIYRAAKAASYESLGVTVIACRHFDPGLRTFTVDFFDADERKVSMFGPYIAAEIPPGKKVVFVTDGRYFVKRDVFDVRLGHLTGGHARVISDAERVRCMGKIRFDGGTGLPSRWTGIGLYREGDPLPTEEPWR